MLIHRKLEASRAQGSLQEYKRRESGRRRSRSDCGAPEVRSKCWLRKRESCYYNRDFTRYLCLDFPRRRRATLNFWRVGLAAYRSGKMAGRTRRDTGNGMLIESQVPQNLIIDSNSILFPTELILLVRSMHYYSPGVCVNRATQQDDQ